MRKVLLLLLILPCFAFAQSLSQAGPQAPSSPEVDAYLQAAGDHAALYQGRIETVFPLQAWNTHPYWHDRDFVTGDVCFGGLVYHDVSLRYDVYSNLLVVRTPVRGLSVIPDQQRIEWFTVERRRYIPFEGRFLCFEYEGDQVSLAHRRVKERTGDVIVGRHTRHALFSTDDYFLVRSTAVDQDAQDTETDDRKPSVIRLKSLRSLTSAFPGQKGQLRDYNRSHRLRYDSAHICPSLTSLVAHLDGLLAVGSDSSRQSKASAVPQGQPTLLQVSPTLSTSAIDLKSYHAFQSGGSPQFEADEAYAAPDVVADLTPIREDHILDEVTVRSFQQKVNGGQVGLEKFRPAQLRNIPLALGEADVMKMVQTLPGVKTMGEASSGFNVRGGAADQNLILLNGNSVYNPMHLFGVFSAFNSDVIGETELYKSSIPSQYGGRISSVMDIHSRIADWREWHGSASIGLLTSRATLEAPLVKDRATLLLGGRTTYSDWMLGMIPEKSGYRNGSAGFWDASATLSTILSSRQRLNVYAYASHDRFSFSDYDRYGYTNLNGAVEWRGRFGDRATSSVSLGIDHYDYYTEESEVPTEAARLSYGINQFFVRSHNTYALNDRHQFVYGLQAQLYDVSPGLYEPVGEQSGIARTELESDRALESAIYAEDQWSLTSRLKVNLGLRYALFNAMHEAKEHTYQAPEFRLSGSYSLTPDQSVKACFNTMHQYIHKVSNTSIMSPTDTWVLSNACIRPQSGWQTAIGYYLQSHDARYELTLEAYYKQMSDYLTYRSAGQLLMNPDLEDDVLPTRGRAYGIELQLRKSLGRLNGWISYSYSRTELQQTDAASAATAINGGDWFPAEYDRPHELKLVANYKFTERYSLSLNTDYSTGRPTTIPAGQYYNYTQGRFLPFYTERNGYRLPDYFRMDASFNIEPSHHLTALFHWWFSIGCYNLLGRKNAYSVYYEAHNGTIQGYRLSIFGAPIPFVSFNVKF